MMICRNIPLLIAALAILAFGQFGTAAASEIGSVSIVNIGAYGTLPGESTERLYVRDDVFVDERIQTVKKANAQIRFIDDTDLYLGPSSEVLLDSFIFDPNQNTGEFVAELGLGVFRFVTGEMPADSVSVLTPVATIGVRGTDFLVEVTEGGDEATILCIRIEVYDGAVTATPREGGGDGVDLETGQIGAGCDPGATVDVTTAVGGLTPPPTVTGHADVDVGGGSGGGSGGGGGGGGH